jgi:hypothetical protein
MSLALALFGSDMAVPPAQFNAIHAPVSALGPISLNLK